MLADRASLKRATYVLNSTNTTSDSLEFANIPLIYVAPDHCTTATVLQGGLHTVIPVNLFRPMPNKGMAIILKEKEP